MTFSALFDEIEPVFELLAETYSGLPLPVQLIVISTFGLFLFFGGVRLFL